MKKVLLLAILQVFALAAMAVPAHPKPVKVQQPDGSYVTIRLHGDEWLNFTTTEDGYSVVKDQRGYYVYAELKDQQLKPTAQVAHDAKLRSAAEQAFLNGVKKYQAPAMKTEKAAEKAQVQQIQRRALASHRATNYNNFRGLVILVQFNDQSFSHSDYAEIADDMLNKENYTGFDSEEYTGSVRDYFSDNSGGMFKPTFDVVGPVTVNFSKDDGRNSSLDIVNAAIDAVDEEVDFSQYDGDGDGNVDLVYFIIAGNGSNYSGNDATLWWPHRSYIGNINGNYIYFYKKDGVYLKDYASSVELYGWTNQPSSVVIDGIGTICHEFSHVLGLPDFYDADYEESGGQSIHPGDWSVMAGGSYNNNGRTPVGYSLYERYSVGFTAEPTKITAKGAYTLEPLYLNQKGYRIDSPVANEFFLLENRQQSAFKWDEYLPGSGLLVHRVDQTDMSVWSSNKVNCDPSHNYYEVVRACGTGMDGEYDVFPGAGGVTELDCNTTPANLKTWSGEETIWGLYSIQENGSNITFTVNPSGDGPVKPTDVAVSNVTATSATVTWVGTNDNYNVRYRTAAQSAVVFEDDFENGLNNWTIYTEGEAPYSDGWVCTAPNSSVNAISGNYVACARSWANQVAYDADNWLVTPQVVLGNQLRFWVYTSSWADSFAVLLSTTGNAINDFTVIRELAKAPKGVWTEVIIDLSSYTGKLGYIAIRHKCYDCEYLLVDDFAIYGEAAPAGEWQTVSSTNSSVKLTGLTPKTTYEVQVQAVTAKGTSDWSSPVTFTTLELSVVPGDANGDGDVTFTDVVAIVNYLLGKPGGAFVLDGADFNNDGKVTISDAVGLLYYLKVQ